MIALATAPAPAPMTGNADCPICMGPSRPFFQMTGSPLLQNVFYATPSEARAASLVDVDFLHCPDCHFVFNPEFHEDRLQYTPAYDNNQLASAQYRQFVDELALQVVADCGLSSSSAVLEIGCGNAYFLSRLRQALGTDQLVGYDPAYAGQHGMAEFIIPARFTRTEGRTFDLIVFRHSLDALLDQDAVLASLTSTMNPHARVYIETFSLEHLIDTQAAALLSHECARYYSLTALSRLMATHGLDLELSRPLFDKNFHGCVFRKRPVAPMIEDPFAALRALLHKRERVVLWGMGGRAVSFLAQSPWARDRIRCVDVDPSKQGRFVPGTDHPILSPAEARALAPLVVIVANAHYFEEIRGTLALPCDYVTLEGTRLGDETRAGAAWSRT
jgi:hypothetical protein